MVVFLPLFLFLKPILCVRLTSSGTSLEWKYPPTDLTQQALISTPSSNRMQSAYTVFLRKEV